MAPIFTSGPSTSPDAELQRLRLALAEKEDRIRQLEQETTRLEFLLKEGNDKATSAGLEAIFRKAAAPVVQLLLQETLLAQGKPLLARDVLAVSRRLVRALLEGGMEAYGNIGAEMDFDPDTCLPLAAGASLEPGAVVIVRIPGIAYRGKILQKVGVERRSD